MKRVLLLGLGFSCITTATAQVDSSKFTDEEIEGIYQYIKELEKSDSLNSLENDNLQKELKELKEEYEDLNDSLDEMSEKSSNESYVGEDDTEVSLIIEFEYNSAYISSEHRKELDALAKKLVATNKEFTIIGHSDPVGTSEHNYSLSQRRALNVKNYLEEQGVSYKLINVKWYGEDDPVDLNTANLGNNRRVEIYD